LILRFFYSVFPKISPRRDFAALAARGRANKRKEIGQRNFRYARRDHVGGSPAERGVQRRSRWFVTSVPLAIAMCRSDRQRCECYPAVKKLSLKLIS
jgi:hypothetical protein